MNNSKAKLQVFPNYQMKKSKGTNGEWVKKGGCGCGKKKIKKTGQ
ncbi:hypothetical protein ACQKCU_20135 [Heyndrickxia sporothermodurans]